MPFSRPWTVCNSSFFFEKTRSSSLHLGANAFRAFIPDDLADLLGVVLGDAFLEADVQVVLLAGELRLVGIQDLERYRALDQLLLEDVKNGLGPLFAVGPDLDRLIARPGNRGSDSAEVEPGTDLLGRLVQRIIDFLAVDLGDDVKGRFTWHGTKAIAAGAGALPMAVEPT